MFSISNALLMCNPETRRIKMTKPNYKKAIAELSVILKAARKRRGLSSISSETTQGIKDVTAESSETAYQFTDFDLTVFKNEPADDDAEKDK